jgi:MurNAc alpha-1-phosphate uridylyltransferase
MKAMVLAAGRGERLRPLTETLPKPLLEVAGKSLIEHQLDRLKAAGIREVVINLHHLGEQIEALLGDGREQGLAITYSVEDELLETGGGIRKALPLLGNEPFLVVSADTYHDIDYSEITSMLDSGMLGLLVMTANPAHHPEGDFSIDQKGVLHHDGKRLTYSGFGVLSPALFAGVTETAFKLRQVFDAAIDAGKMQGFRHDGFWCDVGTMDRYEQLLADVGR